MEPAAEVLSTSTWQGIAALLVVVVIYLWHQLASIQKARHQETTELLKEVTAALTSSTNAIVGLQCNGKANQ